MDLRLILVSIIWGINFSAIKFALTEFHPLGFTVLRFALAAAFLLIVLLINRDPLTIDRQDRWAIIRLGLYGIALYNIFFMYGLQYTTAANSAMLISLSPLFGALIAAASGRERLSPRMIAGLALATAGVILVIRSRHDGFAFTLSGMGGDLLTLCATLCWALYSIAAKPLLERYSATKVTAYAMTAGTVLLLPLSLPGLVSQSWASISAASWSAAAFAAFIAGGAAYVLWYQGIKRIGVTRTMVYHYLMPFAAVLFAAAFLRERITLLQVAGGAAILSGVYLVQKQRQ